MTPIELSILWMLLGASEGIQSRARDELVWTIAQRLAEGLRARGLA